MKKAFLHIYFICVAVFASSALLAQESIFTGFKSDMQKADECYESQAYLDAIDLYTRLANHKKGNADIQLKIANSYYMLRDMSSAVSNYHAYEQNGGTFNQTETFYYASALQASGNYKDALKWFQIYLQENPGDPEILKRIWQLQNIQFLFEDSIFYSVEPISINTESDEFSPSIYNNSIVFISNQSGVQALKRIDAASNKPFFNWYISNIVEHNIDDDVTIEYTKPRLFGKEIQAKYHKSSISFYPEGDTMVYARTSFHQDNSGKSTSKIFFARREGKLWKEFAAFPYNRMEYSVDHPAIGKNGKCLYFTSDMPGGYGKMDIYMSEFVDGKWSRPQNLGEGINTSQNENYPFFQNNTLYFSSDGHPGIGGLDIFSVNMTEKIVEVSNMGYPVNTYYDDFGLTLDNAGSFGYLASNRNQDINNDNIFKIYIKKPNYPLLISGKIRCKKTNLKDSTVEMNQLAYARLELIDISQNMIIKVSESDSEGNFAIEIPYESQFKLSVSQKTIGVAVVSMEIPRNPENYLNHEIVIVKDLFNTKQKNDIILTKPGNETLSLDQ